MSDTYASTSFGSNSSDTASGGLGNINSALATLIADGASPTQAHVTALNTAMQAAGLGTANPAVYVLVDTARITQMSVLRNILDGLASTFAGQVSAT
jgi:hypothetical protein